MDADRFETLMSALRDALTTAPSRRAALRVIGGLGLAGLFSPTDARKKKKKKKCAKAGQTASTGRKNKKKRKKGKKKGKKCCAGLAPDANGVCVSPASPPPPNGCTPATCPANACGDLPDGCGGTLSCGGCTGERICARGVCQDCTVICTASPAECGTVLGAAMSVGGTIYVCPGLYQSPQFGFGAGPLGAAVIGAGEGDDPTSNTILDANGANRVLEVSSGAVELERLRLTGGKQTLGGGILVNSGETLRMTDCTISGNVAEGNSGTGRGGGGIYMNGNATLEMTRCTVRDNHVTGDPGKGGGGILTFGATTLTDCLVETNDSVLFGGGLYVGGGTTTLAGSTQVRSNEADHGGGIFVEAGALTIAETCRVTENTAIDAGAGGGIFHGGTVTLQGASPSPIVVNNCFENCAPAGAIANCSTDPVSPCP